MALPQLAEQARAEPGISRSVIWSYALPGFGVNFLYTLVLVTYLKFATDRARSRPTRRSSRWSS